jgi:hypothetical protein
MHALRKVQPMRFSLVFDDDGTILAASVDGAEIDKPKPGPGVSKVYFDISSDEPDVELNHTVERMLVDLDARELKQSTDRRDADDSE